MTHLSKRLALNRCLPRHLSQLTQLLKREVHREDLLSCNETELILQRAKATRRAPHWKCEIPFAEKSGPRFRGLIKALGALHPGNVYLWTPLATDCGLPRALALKDINFEFDFDLIPDGILEIFTDDLADKMLLDYSLGERDREVLEIEVEGGRWGAIRL